MSARQPAGRRGGTPAVAVAGWHVALPAWGERYLSVAERWTLPALARALEYLARTTSRELRLTVHACTDAPDRVRAAWAASGMGAAHLDLTGVPGPDGAFESMSNFHRAVMGATPPGDCAVLLTADMVVSVELLGTCDRALAMGKKIVCCVAMRATEDGTAPPPCGAPGRDLLAWAWDNRHPMTRECTWPDGRSYDIWRTYYEQGGEVAARVFLPHPLVVVPDGRQLRFGPTIDVNLTANFALSETHMITQPEEGAVVEISPRDKEFLLTTTMRERLDAGGPSCPQLIRCTNPRHRMFWGRRAVIRGSGGDCGDAEVVRRVMG